MMKLEVPGRINKDTVAARVARMETSRQFRVSFRQGIKEVIEWFGNTEWGFVRDL